MKSKRLWLPIFFLFSIIVSSIVYFVFFATASAAQKFVMPGNYRIHLAKDEYTIWYFWEWPSKKIHEIEADPNIKIEEIGSASATRISELDSGQPQTFGENRGRFQKMIRVNKNGNFRLSTQTKCIVVVVVVPSRAFLPDRPAPAFIGAADDTGFFTQSPSKVSE